MKRIFLTISIVTAILAIGFTLVVLYGTFWGDLTFIQFYLVFIGVACVCALLSIASLLAVILLKMTGKT